MCAAISDQELAAVRRHGFGVAYRMLGSVGEAEDVAQEAVLRYTRVGEEVDEPAAWITTAATRLSIDHLRSSRVRRETYVGPWLPEPLVEEPGADPGSRVEMTESLSQAFLVLLERLTPVERAAFLLREVFGYAYREIGAVLDKSEENARQLVARARKHLGAGRPRFDPDEAQRDALLARFLAAAERGDVEGLEQMLAQDAALYSDGGGKAIAARQPLHGAARIALAMARIARKQQGRALEMELVRVNGQPGRVLRTADGAIWDVLTVDVVDGRIQAVRVIRNPDKLAHL